MPGSAKLTLAALGAIRRNGSGATLPTLRTPKSCGAKPERRLLNTRLAPLWLSRSKIRLVGFRDRNESLIEMIVVVFGANHFVERNFAGALVALVTLNRVPRHCEGSGILDADFDLQRLAVIHDLETLHDVQLGRVRRAIIVDIGLVVHADGIDDKRVAVLIMPDGFPVPGRLRIGAVRLVEGDAPHLEILPPDHQDFLRRLNEKYGMDGIEQEAGNAMRPAARAGGEADVPSEHRLIGFSH